jgi:hypothetical protein
LALLVLKLVLKLLPARRTGSTGQRYGPDVGRPCVVPWRGEEGVGECVIVKLKCVKVC